MTSPKLLVPVRVPEIGPALGKVLTGTGRVLGTLPVERYRVQLLSRLFDAAGEARRLAAQGERDAALYALDAQVWLDGWEEAVNGIAAALVAQLNERLEDEAVAVRMPRRLRRKVLLDATEVRGVGGRVGAAGAGLVPALDAMHEAAERLRVATAAAPAALDEWQESVLTAARRLEAAWLGLEDQVQAELDRWAAVADAVAQWGRPMWPVAVVGIPGLAAAAWLGLVLGGYLPSPAWLTDLWARLP